MMLMVWVWKTKDKRRRKHFGVGEKNIYGETPTINALNTQKSCSGPKLPADRTMSDVIHTLPRILLLLLYVLFVKLAYI
jgi:hypothetical protein